MTSSHRHLGIVLVFLGLASILPAAAGAQPPVYLTQWGSLGGENGQFISPLGVATDATGNVYVVDFGNNRIQKFTDTGAYLGQWGTFGDGNGQFTNPTGIATDAIGDVYVIDQLNRVQKFTGDGTYLTQWGSFGSGDGQLQSPGDVATDPAGNVYVMDTGNSRVQKFTGTGIYLTQWGSYGTGNGEFDNAYGVAVDPAGDVYVADTFSNRIQKFTSTGTYLTQWGSFGSDTSADGRLNRPYGLATDAAGNVYVADTQNQRIQKFTGTGVYLTQWGTFGSGNGEFNAPFKVAADAAGNVYVLDTGNTRIQKFGPAPVARPPDCKDAFASDAVLTSKRPKFRNISILGVTDPDGDPVTITVTGIYQDEPVSGKGFGNTCPDARIEKGEASVRVEAKGGRWANGRVYTIYFTAEDGRGGKCTGSVEVCVPAGGRGHDDDLAERADDLDEVADVDDEVGDDEGDESRRRNENRWLHPGQRCVNDGAKYNSTDKCRHRRHLDQESLSIEEVALAVGEATDAWTELNFAIPVGGHVDVSVFDIAGRRMATIENSELAAGVYSRVLSMSSLARGLYYVRLRAAGVSLTRTVVKMR